MSWADRLRPVRRLLGPLETRCIERFGTSPTARAFGAEVLVLETTGRRTGRRRRTAVAHLRRDDGWLIAGGAGGQARVDWVANLRAEPAATIVVDRRCIEVVGEEVTGEVDARAAARARWPRLAGYERAAGRPAPLFLLRPAPR